MTFEERCRLSEQCLPEAPYRMILTNLHNEMLEALAQPQYVELIPGMRIDPVTGNVGIGSLPTQPQQEPPFSVQQAYAMAQVCLDMHDALGCVWGDNVYLTISQLKAQPQQEPVAIALNTGTKQGVKWLKNVEHGENLYTSPPQRTWVGLTDEEALECWPGLAMYADCAKFWENIEAKLKEKNT